MVSSQQWALCDSSLIVMITCTQPQADQQISSVLSYLAEPYQ